MPTYNNPASVRPQFPEMPGGALAGVMAARDRTLYEQNMSIAQQMQAMEAAKQMEELEMGAPVRSAERGQKVGEADLAGMIARQKSAMPGYGNAMARGAMGEAGVNEARGREALGTVDQKIGATNEENRGKQTQEFLKRIDSSRPLFEDPTEVAPGVTRGSQAYQQFLQSVPEGARKHLPSTYDKGRMDAIRKALVDSVSQGQASALAKQKEDADYKKQELVNRGNLDVANARRLAHVKSLMVNFQSAKTPEQAAFAGDMILSDPEVDEPTKAIVRRGVETAKRIIAEKTGKGQIDFRDFKNPGAIPNAINERLGGQGGAAQQPPAFQDKAKNPGGWPYEPDKYNYQMGSGGVLQRKPKAK